MYSADWVFNWFDFVPSWVIQDVIILLLGVICVIYIARHEKRPTSILLEMFGFIFLYAALYENFATVIGLYGFGPSIVMVFNVPITIPLIEFLFVYVTLKMAKKMKIKAWMIPLFVGVFGVLADLTLDPLALSQVANTKTMGTIGRWTWFIGESDVNIFGVPIYNFTGWMLLCGYASVYFLLGRYWHKRSNYKTWVGIAYPLLASLAGFLTMISPLSGFLLYLDPFIGKGGNIEYVMLGLCFAALLIVLLFWKGRMRERLSFKCDYPIWIIYGVFHISNIIFMVINKRFDILLFSLPFVLLQMGIITWAFLSKKIKEE